MKSIQTKFIALILGCVLLSSVVIGGAGIWSAKRVVDKDSAKMMNLMCGEKAAELNGLLERIEQSVKTLSAYTLEELDSVERFKTDDIYLNEYTKKLEGTAKNITANTGGALGVYIRFNPEITNPESGLFWSKSDLNGRLNKLPTTDFSAYSKTDFEHVGWYYVPVENGKPTWMSPYINPVINKEVISYVIPMYMGNETVGVVGMDVDYSVLKDAVAATKAYQSGYSFLTNGEGSVMYHEKIETNATLNQMGEDISPVSGEMKIGTDDTELFSYTYGGSDKKMAFRNLRNGMRFAISAPLSEIDAAKNRLILQIGTALVVICAISVVLTILFTRKLIRPLRELNTAAKKIADGDFSVTITSTTKDEIGTLAESFRQTVSYLQQYINYINGLAYRDGLTGVKNKTAYQDIVKKLDMEVRIGRPEFAVIVFDINGLKAVNDTQGHDFGDMLIIDACKVISKVFKRSPIFRIGGDEFVAILETGDYEHYHELLKSFEAEIAIFNKLSKKNEKISIARGIALYEENSDLTFGDVFKRADDAMYQNKNAMKKLNKNGGQ